MPTICIGCGQNEAKECLFICPYYHSHKRTEAELSLDKVCVYCKADSEIDCYEWCRYKWSLDDRTEVTPMSKVNLQTNICPAYKLNSEKWLEFERLGYIPPSLK